MTDLIRFVTWENLSHLKDALAFAILLGGVMIIMCGFGLSARHGRKKIEETNEDFW